MTHNYDSRSWEAKMDALEIIWHDRISDIRDEYKSQFLDLYGIPLVADQESLDSD